MFSLRIRSFGATITNTTAISDKNNGIIIINNNKSSNNDSSSSSSRRVSSDEPERGELSVSPGVHTAVVHGARLYHHDNKPATALRQTITGQERQRDWGSDLRGELNTDEEKIACQQLLSPT
ncbi:hypothetical protein ElyMa_006521000 [Elysia marginata]|uniref:Uncharacterized protein n=1 Tax=Elysia marginata TaxID=1093978 RepID=A0AAV4I8R4_9GAST|nr:hypothetical protein ElyMa_006521000 [Elysia marginata]